MKKLDSNNLKTTIHVVCSDCGKRANRATCLKKYGAEPKKEAFDISTLHVGKCDFCGEKKDITQTRDFFYPDFNLIKK